MKSYVITIQEMSHSIRSANKCIMSASDYDIPTHHLHCQKNGPVLFEGQTDI